MDSFMCAPQLLKKYKKLTTGLLACYALDRAKASVGSFGINCRQLAEAWGVSDRTVRDALRDLEKSGAIACIGGGKKGVPKQWIWREKKVVESATYLRGVNRLDFKGVVESATYFETEAREGLARWGLCESDVDAVIAEYGAAWVWCKLDDCSGRMATAKRPAAYIRAALATIGDEGERKKARKKLTELAKHQAKEQSEELERRIWRRQRELQDRFRGEFGKRAARWWESATEGEREAVLALHAERVGELWEFRPGVCNASDDTLLRYWSANYQTPRGNRIVACDVQADGRLFWLRLLDGPRSTWLDGAGIAGSTAEVPTEGAKVIVDAGDGNAMGWVLAWVAELRAAGVDALAWKGGAHAEGAELRAWKDEPNAVHGNERHWAGEALAVLDGGGVKVRAELLGDHYDLWHSLASRLDLETAGGDDHWFDGLKMGLAMAKGVRGV